MTDPMKTLPTDPFLRGYIVSALWTTDPCPGSGDYEANGRPEELIDRVPGKFLAEAERDCLAFRAKLGVERALSKALQIRGLDLESCGHDLWLTRNGHGTGYWDRDLGDYGDVLNDAAQAMGEHHLELGGWWRVEYRCPKCREEWTHDEDAEGDGFGESHCEHCNIPVLSLNREQGEHMTDIDQPEGEG